MRSIYIWWAQLLGSLALPFALVIAMHQLASLAPGTIKVSHWEMVSSTVFLLAVIPVFILLLRKRLHWSARLALGVVFVPVLVFSAFIMQIHSTCVELPTHIGVKPKPIKIASCN